MPDPEELNPYPEDEPMLQEAWAEGYQAGKEGPWFPNIGKQVHGDPRKDVAWLKGYTAARLEESEERPVQRFTKRVHSDPRCPTRPI